MGSTDRSPTRAPTSNDLARSLRAIADVLDAPAPIGTTVDDLVVFPFGLEAEAARSLLRRGLLRAPKIGRKRYARRSALLALVDRLADEEVVLTASKPKAGESAHAAYLRLVAPDARREPEG